eukprot:scaffold44931_cov72-Phaeocystis_antarctica.AAC.4
MSESVPVFARSIPASSGSASDLTVPHCKRHASNGPAQAHDPHALHASEHVRATRCRTCRTVPAHNLLPLHLHAVITTYLLQATLRRAKQLGLCTLNLVDACGAVDYDWMATGMATAAARHRALKVDGGVYVS